jgi:Zn-finger nucleic acid-binding protein
MAAMALPLPPAPPEDFKVHYLKCPACGDLMNRTNYAHESGVIINTCRKHGVWFDHDGLRRVIEFIRNGGLQRARSREAEDAEREVALAKQATYFEGVQPESLSSYFGGSSTDVLGALAHIVGGLTSRRF